ncbi:hypothetical protein Fmac_027978 [Flemingia macrophylla]|uniref:Uncharacterized protein n=1 Tax=Flemingia macrophylla TaxID=520843 RepID=A0ABD1LJ94_9FABA
MELDGITNVKSNKYGEHDESHKADDLNMESQNESESLSDIDDQELRLVIDLTNTSRYYFVSDLRRGHQAC